MALQVPFGLKDGSPLRSRMGKICGGVVSTAARPPLLWVYLFRHIPGDSQGGYSSEMKTVLIIEPDALLREALALTLQGAYRIVSLRSIKEALMAIAPESISAVVLGTLTSQSEIKILRLRLGLIPFFLLPGLAELAEGPLVTVVDPLSGDNLRHGLHSVLKAA